MISQEGVQKIAKLARIELTDQEIEKLQRDLSAILDYFEILQNAPGVLTGSHSIERSVLRDDVALSDPLLAGDLVNAAPDKKDGYIKVKAVL